MLLKNLKGLGFRVKNLKGYPHIEVSLIIRSGSQHIQNVSVVTACPSLNLRNLSDNVLTFLNKDWSVFLTVLMLPQLSWSGKRVDLFEYVSITQH